MGTLKAIAVTEANIYLLNKLRGLGLATNDVRNFTEKQVIHKKVKQSVDPKVSKVAMQSKKVDACVCIQSP